MAPAMSRHQAQSTRKADLIEQLMKKRLAIVQKIAEKMQQRKRRSELHTVTKQAAYKFYVEKVEFLIRNGEISSLVGISTETFEEILLICKKSTVNIPQTVRVSIFLQFCREGVSQNVLARHIGISQSSISRIITDCISDLVGVAENWIRFPKTKSEIRAMQLKFLNRTDSYGNVKGVPCFVILDGKHWKTDHPPKTGSLNYNYKGFYSFNSLFLSDADTRIVYLQISKLGVNSDAQLYRNGPLDGLLKAAAATAGMLTLPGSHHVMPAFCLADNGFGLTKQMMTPYRANQLASNGHIVCNEIISSTRVKIENLFGILTSKFQVFSRNLRLDPVNSRALIVACSVIHNMSLGPSHVPSLDFSDEPIVIDPYKNAEEQRTALKAFLLSR